MKSNKRISALLLAMLLLLVSGCGKSVEDSNLVPTVTGETGLSEVAQSKEFTDGYRALSMQLLQKTFAPNENSLISPLSVSLALSMCANGAAGETAEQMLMSLCGLNSIAELNEQLYSLCCRLVTSERTSLEIANSIWLRDSENLAVKDDFLKAAASYYNAGAFKKAFDSTTLKEINRWTSEHTDGMIEKIIDEISPEAMVYLINAIIFDGEWSNPYKEFQVSEDDFTNIDGTIAKAQFMRSDEYSYLSDEYAQGFTKPYSDGYSFVALLPNEGVSCEEYLAKLTAESYEKLMAGETDAHVAASVPKFKYDCDYNLSEALSSLGMPLAFDPERADFSDLAELSDGTKLYISKVLHKTHIEVNESGTKAAAVTAVEMECGCSLEDPSNVIEIVLDRPFIYMIVENETNLPLFCGYMGKLAQ